MNRPFEHEILPCHVHRKSNTLGRLIEHRRPSQWANIFAILISVFESTDLLDELANQVNCQEKRTPQTFRYGRTGLRGAGQPLKVVVEGGHASRNATDPLLRLRPRPQGLRPEPPFAPKPLQTGEIPKPLRCQTLPRIILRKALGREIRISLPFHMVAQKSPYRARSIHSDASRRAGETAA